MFDFDDLPDSLEDQTGQQLQKEIGLAPRWAPSRHKELEKELRGLDCLQPDKQRARLRELQREFHPDKQPPEFRACAKELFLLVQNKWEAFEAQRAPHGKHGCAENNCEVQGTNRAGKKVPGWSTTAGDRNNQADDSESQSEEETEEDDESDNEAAHVCQNCGSETPLGNFATESQYAGEWFCLSCWARWSSTSKPWKGEAVELEINSAYEGHLCKIVVDRSWTVHELKEMLARMLEMPPDTQRILLGERELAAEQILGSVLPTDRTVDLCMARRSGPGSFLEKAMRQNWRAMKHAPPELLKDRELLLHAVKQNWQALQHAPPASRADREFVLIAVQQSGLALELASSTLRADRDLVLMAVRQDWRAFQFASRSLQGDHAIAAEAIHQDIAALKYVAPKLRAHRELFLLAVHKDGSALQYASAQFLSDREVVLAAVRQNGKALQHAALSLRSDKEFMLAAVWQNGAALRFVAPELREDPDLIDAVWTGM